MIFIWIALYGAVHIASDVVEKSFFHAGGFRSVVLLVYAAALLFWCYRAKKAEQAGLGLFHPHGIGGVLLALPLFSLALCNVLLFGVRVPGLFSVMLCLGASVAEEVFFRGFLYSRLAEHNKHAELLSAAVFAVFHLINTLNGTALTYLFFQVLCAFCAGLAFSCARKKYGSIYVCIAAHFIINLSARADSAADVSLPMAAGYAVCSAVYLVWAVTVSRGSRRQL